MTSKSLSPLLCVTTANVWLQILGSNRDTANSTVRQYIRVLSLNLKSDTGLHGMIYEPNLIFYETLFQGRIFLQSSTEFAMFVCKYLST